MFSIRYGPTFVGAIAGSADRRSAAQASRNLRSGRSADAHGPHYAYPRTDIDDDGDIAGDGDAVADQAAQTGRAYDGGWHGLHQGLRPDPAMIFRAAALCLGIQGA